MANRLFHDACQQSILTAAAYAYCLTLWPPSWPVFRWRAFRTQSFAPQRIVTHNQSLYLRQSMYRISTISGHVLRRFCVHVPLKRFYLVGKRLCTNFQSCHYSKYVPPHVHPECRRVTEIMFFRDWNDSVEAGLKNSGVVLSHDLVDQIIACIPNPKLALQFYIWAGEQIGYPPLHSSAAYEMTQWYSSKSQIRSFLRILRVLAFPHGRLTPSMVNVLLQGYGWAGMVDRAFKILLETEGFSNYKSVHCLLQAIIKERRYDLVDKVYLEMHKHGTRVDVSCSLLIYGMSCDGKWHCADDLMQQVLGIGCSPDAVAYNMLIVSLTQAGQLRRACELLHDMLSRNMLPESKVSHAVVEGLHYHKQQDQVLKLLNALRMHGHDMNSELYISIGGFWKEDVQNH